MKKYFILTLVLAFTAVSCAKMLDLNPHSAIAPDSVTEDDVPQLRIGMYWKVQELPQRETYILDDLIGGNLTAKNSTSTIALINSILNAQSSIVKNAWQGSYKALYQINNVISIAENKLPDGSARNRILGEACYLRAYTYLRLVTHFGDVPLLVSNTQNDVPRSPASSVWEQIESDLLTARELLSAKSNCYYVSSDAATALLSRVKLYRGKKSEAKALAESLISNPSYRLDSFSSMFREGGASSPEIIFAFKCGKNDGSGISISTLFYSYNHPNKGSYIYMPAPEVMTLYEDGDSRKEITVTTMDGLDFINKYPSGQSGTDPVIVSRLAEMYLISAEASGMNGGLSRLNQLRGARGLDPVYPATEAAFQEAVALERRREFVGEGHRYYDLVRSGKAVSQLGIQPYQTVLPLPEAELQNNLLLTQNEQY